MWVSDFCVHCVGLCSAEAYIMIMSRTCYTAYSSLRRTLKIRKRPNSADIRALSDTLLGLTSGSAQNSTSRHVCTQSMSVLLSAYVYVYVYVQIKFSRSTKLTAYHTDLRCMRSAGANFQYVSVAFVFLCTTPTVSLLTVSFLTVSCKPMRLCKAAWPDLTTIGTWPESGCCRDVRFAGLIDLTSTTVQVAITCEKNCSFTVPYSV